MTALGRIALVGWVACAAVGALAAHVHADPDPRRSVAVLEYRSGSSELRDAASRVAAVLTEKTSLAVASPAEARRRYGSRLDRQVADCAGAAACIARLGDRLEVGEIVLVGVSQFGDVILTLQRIDVADSQVVARVAEAMAPGSQPDDDQLEQWLQRVMPESDFVRHGLIKIEANVAGATVYLGEEDRGQTPVEPLRVPAPASYDIRLDKDGYVPFRATVEVPPDAQVMVRPQLELRGQGGAAWYRRWWVWAIAGTVVAGTVAAVAVTRGPDSDVPVVIQSY